MGLLDDIQKGLGFKDRDKKYYERTAKSITNQRGEAAGKRYRDTTGLSSGGNIGSPGMPQRGGLLSGMRFGEYRDINDMFDRGGPDASGGKFEGGGLLSAIANVLYGSTAPTRTEGFGSPSSMLETAGTSGMSRPYDAEFYRQYLNAQFTQQIPPNLTYDQYYDQTFP